MQVTPLQIAIWSTAWAALGWLVGHFLAIGRDSRSKLNRFRSFLEVFRKKIEAVPVDDFIYDRGIRRFPELEKEYMEIRHFIAARKRVASDSALKRYNAISFDTWAGPDKDRQHTRDTQNSEFRNEMISCLSKIYECTN